MKEAAREARLAALPDAAFLRISKAEIDARGKWEEPGRECWFKGHLYDVMRTRRVGDTTWLFCLDDQREEQLVRQADAVTKANQDHPDKKSGHSLTISIAIGDMLFEMPVWVVKPLPVDFRQYFPSRVHLLPSRYARIVIPPPKYPPVLFC